MGDPFGGLVPGALGATLRVLLRTGVPLTGRRVHQLTTGGHSLTAVQSALHTLDAMGLVETTPAGRATLHTINPDHVAVPVLRKLLDPRELLREIVVGVVSDDPRVRTVAAFGSVGRGEAGPDSDIDLVVLTTCDPLDWDSRTELAAAVERRIGNRCDTLVFGIDEFNELVGSGAEPVVRDIVRDRFLLFGEPLAPKAALSVRARDTARV